MDNTIPQNTPQKQCSKCEKWFPATTEYFHINKDFKDLLHNKCKNCRNKKPAQHAQSGNKICNACGKEKPATLQYFHAGRGKRGLHPRCKDCRSQRKGVPVPVPDGYKRCTKCETIKPATLDCFVPLRTGSGGLYPSCRECCREKNRLYMKRERDEINKRRRARRPLQRERIAQQSRRRYLANREAVIAYNKRYYAANKERCSIRQRKYYLAHQERYAETRRIYRQAHKEQWADYYRAAVRNRRARLKSIPGSHTAEEIRQQFKRQKGKCYYCRNKLTKYHIDHTFPVTREHARNSIDHLVLTCPPCNQSKGNKYPWEWPEGGRLL